MRSRRGISLVRQMAGLVAVTACWLPVSLGAECRPLPDDARSSRASLLAFGDLAPPTIRGVGPDRLFSIADFTAERGTPTRRESSSFVEHYTGETTERITLSYPGIVAVAVGSPGTRQLRLETLTIRTGDVDLPGGLRVGEELARFREVLGKTDQPPPEPGRAPRFFWNKYECRDDTWHAWHATIELLLGADGRVSQVSWHWYSD